MSKLRSMPGMRPGAIFLVALSLSIGWGIRGNFGHESGAMIAGVLAAVAACLLSGREDWQRRVAFFAFFGGLGWGFGGSISYMYPISFAGSEQWATAIYGFYATFLIGFLWAGLGGMGTALPAVMERNRLNAFFGPVIFTLAAMTISNLWVQPWLADNIVIPRADLMDDTWSRHHNPLYWYDADWFPACAALVGVCLYDLWDRRFDGWRRLLLFACAGAVGGAIVYRVTGAIGLNARIASLLVVPLGDANAINPATGAPFGENAFLNNWPNFVTYYPQHLGWFIGLIAGLAHYFFYWGQWRHDAKFIVYLAGGWLLAFILIPTLGTIPLQSIGGFRLTPPRSDDWAGVTGMFIAGSVYCLRHKLGGAAFAASLTGIIGGFFFAFVPFLRAFLRLPGHPLRAAGDATNAWAHYQSANWHSVMEQLHGFGHGVALAIAMGMLAYLVKPHDDSRDRKRSIEFFAIGYVLFFITLMNVFKNVRNWTHALAETVPETMKAPFIASFDWSAETWFLITWCALALSVVALMYRHMRRPLPIVPASWTARGQLLYLAFLWIMVVANFERALVSFHENRLVTEWVIIMNAALAMFLIIALPRETLPIVATPPKSYGNMMGRLWLYATPLLVLALLGMAVSTRLVYGDQPLEGSQINHKRWGEDAQWRIRPILKGGRHL